MQNSVHLGPGSSEPRPQQDGWSTSNHGQFLSLETAALAPGPQALRRVTVAFGNTALMCLLVGDLLFLSYNLYRRP